MFKEYLCVFSIDPQEFRQWAAAGGAANASSSSSSYEASAGGIAADSEIGASASQAVYGSQGEIQSSGTLVVGEVGNAYESSSAIAGNEILQTSETAFESGSTQQSVQYSSTNGIFNDPNPQILRRAATGGAVTYEQKILVKFLQPPPVPPPGVNISTDISNTFESFVILAVDYQRSSSTSTATTTTASHSSTCTSSSSTTTIDST